MIEIWAFVVIGITYTTNPPTATDQINSFVTRDDCLRYMMTANEQTTLMTDEKHIFIVSACKEINPYNAHTPKTVVPDALPEARLW